MKRYPYTRTGMLAINPRAFAEVFQAPVFQGENPTLGGAVIVEIKGPLDRRAGGWCDNYDAIRERYNAACEASEQTIVLRVDSPGGDVSGCFELARHMREMAEVVNKKLIAYVDGQACSAGYAIAAAASEIVVPSTGFVGSIGVIDARVDLSAQDAACGVRFAFTASGKRKTDGNPHQPLSEAEQAESQARVDSLAELFFSWIQETRGIDASVLEARIFHGAGAVAQGLADRVQSFDGLIASLAGAGAKPMSSKYEEALAALREASEGEGDDAARAKKMLAAAESDDDGEDAEAEDDGEEAKAESEPDGDEPPPEKKKDDAKASRVSAASAGAVASHASTMAKDLAELKLRFEAVERREFLATRKDLAPAFIKTLAKLPLADVKAMVGAIPRPKRPDHAATAVVPATQGANAPNTPRQSPEAANALKLRMGLIGEKFGVIETEHTLQLGAILPAETKGA